MWPLLQRDGLALQYVAVILLWNRLIGYNPFTLGRKSLTDYVSAVSFASCQCSTSTVSFLPQVILAACISLHVFEAVVPPPNHLPHIYPVLNVLLSTPVFAFTWLWSIKRSAEVSWGSIGLGTRTDSSDITQSKSFHGHNGAPTEDGDVQDMPRAASTSFGIVDSGDRPSNLRTRSLGYSKARRTSLRSGGFSVAEAKP